jgi:hypothetical protein
MNKTGTTLIWVAHLLETVGTVLRGQAEVGVPLAETQRGGGEYCILLIRCARIIIFSNRQNPGNNLHVSGLSHKVDTRELEASFAKVGRVSHTNVA